MMKITHLSAQTVSHLDRWKSKKSPLERGGHPDSSGWTGCVTCVLFHMKPTCPEKNRDAKDYENYSLCGIMLCIKIFDFIPQGKQF